MIVSAVYDKDNIKELDGFIKAPVSRSQVLNALLKQALRSPEFLKDLINSEQEKINSKIANSENSI
uniref:ORF21 n=1 Tax=Nitrosopumilaceae spindle-shaped virus TaxID=3065433 RepID=A0AAT9JGC7_9VIRU